MPADECKMAQVERVAEAGGQLQRFLCRAWQLA